MLFQIKYVKVVLPWPNFIFSPYGFIKKLNFNPGGLYVAIRITILLYVITKLLQ